MTIEEFLQAITPKKITDILDRRVLQHLLNGYALEAGICILFPKDDSADWDRLDAVWSKRNNAFDPLCRCLRDKDECNQVELCKSTDQKAAHYYLDQDGEAHEFGVRIYRCEPLGLWDMTFPNRLEGKLLGVLFGGQKLLDNDAGDVLEAFKQPRANGEPDMVRALLEMKLEIKPEYSETTHKEYVSNRIETLPIPENEKQKLLNILLTNCTE